MHFAPSISDTALALVIQKVLVIGTPKAWKQRIAEYEAVKGRNLFVAPYYAERHALEISMDRLQKHKQVTGRLPHITAADQAMHRLFSFAAMLVNVYERVSRDAQRALAGRVYGGLRDEVGLAPLAFELLIAAHLMERGAEVGWHDLESGGGYDFVARRGEAEVEVVGYG